MGCGPLPWRRRSWPWRSGLSAADNGQELIAVVTVPGGVAQQQVSIDPELVQAAHVTVEQGLALDRRQLEAAGAQAIVGRLDKRLPGGPVRDLVQQFVDMEPTHGPRRLPYARAADADHRPPHPRGRASRPQTRRRPYGHVRPDLVRAP